MIVVKQSERGYILAGNYQLLDAVISDANRQILLLEKKYDEMLERKNKEIAALKQNKELPNNTALQRAIENELL